MGNGRFRLGGGGYFLTLRVSSITATITRQNANNPVYVTMANLLEVGDGHNHLSLKESISDLCGEREQAFMANLGEQIQCFASSE